MSNMIWPARFGSAAFAPSDLASLQAWYDASQLTGSDGDRKASFPDRKGSFNGSSANGGLLKTGANGLNSKNILLFDASISQYYDLSSSLMNGATAGAWFAIMNATADPASSSSHAGAVLDGFTNDTSGSKSSHHPFTDSNLYEHFGRSSGRFSNNPTPSLAAWRLYSAHMASGGSQSVYLDATQLGSTATGLTVNFGNVTRKIGVSLSGSNFYDGKVAEILVFNSDVTADRQKVEGYLMWKWGLQANLPGGHPYASAAP